MKIRVVLQARLSSSRLPGKVLLPVAGIPLIELAYRRASNTGLDVIVATSTDESDDVLADFLHLKKIPFKRGSLTDVLGRVYECCKDMPEDSIIVRLTGDNVVPDGDFIHHAVEELKRSNFQYIRSDMSTYPYGLSVEVFYKKNLDEANHDGKDDYDREHVTPFIRRKYGDNVFIAPQRYSPDRVTIDYFSDYLALNNLFKFSDKPLEIRWSDLLHLKKNIPEVANKLVLGGAQFGNSYGITSKGIVTIEIVHKILKLAEKSGINLIDTARAYGNSEEIIGLYLKHHPATQLSVMTKLDHLIPETLSANDLEKWIRASVLESILKLKQDFLPILMFHRISQINKTSLEILDKLQVEGLIKKIGVSINGPDELDFVLKWGSIRHIQLPISILDHRWREEQVCQKLKMFCSEGGTIHGRSAFLQGLLFVKDPSAWPILDFEYDSSKIIANITKLEMERNRSIAVLSLEYLSKLEWISGIVIGVESDLQLNEILTDYKLAQDASCLVDSDLDIFSDLPVELLTPSKWKKNYG